MNAIAPICPISRDQPVPGQFLLTMPPLPLATDLASAIKALNQINAILRQLGPGLPQNNFPQAIPKPTGSSGVQGGSKFMVHWQEESRETELVDLCDPNGDPEHDFVTVPRITRVVFASPSSALIKLIWNLRP